jgi:type IV pilus assembly protein PilE
VKKAGFGFTLIELMIAVAVIGILASIAYPSYNSYVLKSRRAAAQADLTELSQWLERQFTANYSYLNAAGTAPTLPITQSPRSGTAYYTLEFDGAVTKQNYQLKAVPQGAQQKDTCGTLTLSRSGAKTAAVTNCW